MITLREREKKKNEDDLIKLGEKENISEIFNEMEERKQKETDVILSNHEKMKTKNATGII